MRALVFEEHSSVLAQWWQWKIRDATLVYFDAHLDLQFISPARIERLRACTSSESVSKLAKPHHHYPDACAFDPVHTYSYSIEDFLYAACQLGMIRRVVWVAPPHVEMANPQQALTQLSQMDGVTIQDLTSFHRIPDASSSESWIEGKILGLELVICSHDQLTNMSLPDDCLVDIDIDYFVSVPGDILGVSPGVVADLVENISPQQVTISRSIRSGFTPLRYRFLADFLQAQLEGDRVLDDHFERLLQVDEHLHADNHKLALGIAISELESFPNCEATHYFISKAMKDSPRAKHYRELAIAHNHDYRPSLLRTATEFAGRRLDFNAETIEQFATVTEKHHAEELTHEEALASVAVGLLWCHIGDVDEAQECLNECFRIWGGQCELALELGIRLIGKRTDHVAASHKNTKHVGANASAVDCFQMARHDDKTRTAAETYLGLIFFKSGNFERAAELLEAASQRAPAWETPLLLLAKVREAQGETAIAQDMLHRTADMQQQFQDVLNRLQR